MPETFSTSHQANWITEHIVDKLLLNPLPHRGVFNTFANRVNPDQATLVRSTLLLCLLMEIRLV